MAAKTQYWPILLRKRNGHEKKMERVNEFERNIEILPAPCGPMMMSASRNNRICSTKLQIEFKNQMPSF